MIRLLITTAFLVLLPLHVLAFKPISAPVSQEHPPPEPPVHVNLSDIDQQLSTGQLSVPGQSQIQTDITLNDIQSKLPKADLLNGAIPLDVRQGTTFWGLQDGVNWGKLVGTRMLPWGCTFKPEGDYAYLWSGKKCVFDCHLDTNSTTDPGSMCDKSCIWSTEPHQWSLSDTLAFGDKIDDLTGMRGVSVERYCSR
jgi:hypothetical protein